MVVHVTACNVCIWYDRLISLSLNKRDLRQFQNCQASDKLYKGSIATQIIPLEKRTYEGAFYN
jgi:hypothetical protein